MKTVRIAVAVALALAATFAFVETSVAAERLCSSKQQVNMREACKKGEKEIAEISLCKAKTGRVLARAKCKKSEETLQKVKLQKPAPKPPTGGSWKDHVLFPPTNGGGLVDPGPGGKAAVDYDCDDEACWCDSRSDCEDMIGDGVCGDDWNCSIDFSDCICWTNSIGGGGKGGFGGSGGFGGGGVIIQ